MSKATTVLDEIAQLSDSLSETEDRIGELRDELRSFSDDGSDESYTPTTLAADWDFNKATAELNGLLQKRHTDTARYRELAEKLETAKQAEAARLKADLTRKYKLAIKAMLSASINLAHAIRDAESIRDDARDTFGGAIGFLVHVGPQSPQWDMRARSKDSLPHWWARQAIEAGYIDPTDDKLLSDLKL